MALPTLVIDFSENLVKGAAFSAQEGELVASASVRIAPGEAVRGAGTALSELLKAVAAQLGSRPEGGAIDYAGVFGDVYLSLPPSLLSLRVLKLPFTDRVRIKEVLRFELQGLLPYDVADAVIDGIPLQDGRVLAVAVEKQALKRLLEAMKSLGLDPVWAGLASLAIPAFIEATLKPGGTAAFVSMDSIAVERDGNNLFFNSFTDISALKLSLGYLNAEGIRVERFCCVEEAESPLRGLVGEGTEVDVLKLPGDAPGWLAASFALMWSVMEGRLSEAVDLRTGEFEFMERRLKAARKLKLTAALGCLIAVLLVGDLCLRYLKYSGVLNAYNTALTSEYLKLFPGERGKEAAPDAAYLLKAKLKALNKEAGVAGGGLSALKLLNGLTRAAAAAPQMQIKLLDVTAADGRLNARGRGASFEAANRFKETLEAGPLFTNVDLTEVKANPAGGVSFSLSAGI